MKRRNDTIEYGIIGLGRFGTALATALSEAGKEVMVVDNTESKVKQIRDLVSEAFVVEGIDRDSFESAGIQNCETVIVCIGEKIDTSILATLTVISMGVPRVISKATSAEHGCVLEKIGAEVVYPEKDIAIRLARRLVSPHALDFISLNDDIAVSEIRLTSVLEGRSVMEAGIRNRFGLNIVAMERERDTTIDIQPTYRFRKEDVIVVIGKQQAEEEAQRLAREQENTETETKEYGPGAGVQ